jgi:dihydrodipicolinate synthase/N-acetylneuraminate lyase
MANNIYPATLLDALREVHVYVTTPFTDDLLKVDLDALQNNLNGLIDRGVRICAVGGGTGEADALSHDEQFEIAKAALESVGKRALVVATLGE